MRSIGTLDSRLNVRDSADSVDDTVGHFGWADRRRHSLESDSLASFESDAVVQHSKRCQPNSMDTERDYCRSFQRIGAAMDPDPMANSQPNSLHTIHYFGQSIEMRQLN